MCLRGSWPSRLASPALHTHIYIYIYIYIYIQVLLHALWSRVRGEEFGAIMQEKLGGAPPVGDARGTARVCDSVLAGRCARREKGKEGEFLGWRSEATKDTVACEARKGRRKRARLLSAVLAASLRSLLDYRVVELLGADGARGDGSPESCLCVLAKHELVKAVAPCSDVELLAL